MKNKFYKGNIENNITTQIRVVFLYQNLWKILIYLLY
ncbi:hypothetical protein RAYM_00220 [Riemerella anatipestifer RA-YM]|nr:hypothetical protein RAYM_00220 [Riemerella anatipestifer RA-YM]